MCLPGSLASTYYSNQQLGLYKNLFSDRHTNHREKPEMFTHKESLCCPKSQVSNFIDQGTKPQICSFQHTDMIDRCGALVVCVNFIAPPTPPAPLGAVLQLFKLCYTYQTLQAHSTTPELHNHNFFQPTPVPKMEMSPSSGDGCSTSHQFFL